MGRFETRFWSPVASAGRPRKYRGSGEIHAYVPDLLATAPIEVTHDALNAIVDAQSAAVRADASIGTDGIYLNHLLIRSESIASSNIEGLRISPKRLAIAGVTGLERENALEVMANVRATEYAIDALAEKDRLTVDDLIDLQHTICPDLERGVRRAQNWVGGPSPLHAAFVPPPPEYVEPLLEDLVSFINDSPQPALLVAAIAHAQFETIHPFEDGNGRTGRALIHTVLKREGVMRHTVLPISIVFANDTRDYIAGLNAFRETPPRAGDWLQGFAAATEAAAATTLELQRRVQHLDELLVQRLLDWRVEHGRSARPRPEATVLRIIQGLASEPVMTTKGVADRFGVSTVAADNALKELTAAGIVSKQKHKGAVVCYASDEHLAIVSLAERRLFAGGWDTAQRPTNSELALPNTEIDWRSAEDAARRDQVD